MTKRTDSDGNSTPRRRLLKALAAGSGVFTGGALLPSTWTTPVIDEVLLPAHAQTTCTPVDDEFFLNPGGPGGSVPAPGVLQNDSCSTVTDFGNLSVLEGGGNVSNLVVTPDGSFSYDITAPETRFRFTYTTESGETATVIVNHDFDFSGDDISDDTTDDIFPPPPPPPG